ncbi:MAG: hypothetical protein N2Z70_07065 [Bdellovibrionaceae bacterium]|nr:hypothetical protein [Pseudobdellovibrionaceae bacterium]
MVQERGVFFSKIRDFHGVMFEFHPSGSLFAYNGLRWESLPSLEKGQFEEGLESILNRLGADVRLKHKNQMSWRSQIEIGNADWICHYSFEYQSLRISRAPSRQARLEEWGFTETQIRALSYPGQLTLVTGPQLSGKSTVQRLLFRSAELGGALPVWKTPGHQLSSPRLWYFGDERNIQPKEATELVFKGQSVCLAFESLDLETCLTRFFCEVDERLQERLVMQLNVVEVRLLPGTEQLIVPFSSFYQLRYCPEPMIAKRDWASLQTWNEGSKDAINVRSLNQALLQGVIRRRIDMETAFAASPHPEGLDLLLKRIGV